MRILLPVLILSLVSTVACSSIDEPAYVGDPEVGRDVAERLCSSCHAVGVTGASPNAAAVPFRHILADRDAARLAKDLDEAVSISHLRMPTFYFGEHHAADLVAYIETIQETPRASP